MARHWTQMKRETFLKVLLRQAMDDIAEAREKGSWTPVERLSRLAMSLRDELDGVGEEHKEEVDVTKLPPEEWAVLVQEDADAASSADLEVYVLEWLRRSKLRMVPGPDGIPVIERTL